MAGTLHPDPEFQRFNKAKENAGNYFRFKPKSAFFNIIFMGLIPASIAYFAYANEGQINFYRKYRKDKVLYQEYELRDKDLK